MLPARIPNVTAMVASSHPKELFANTNRRAAVLMATETTASAKDVQHIPLITVVSLASPVLQTMFCRAWSSEIAISVLRKTA
jgi:hypothetical protein